MMKRQKMRLLGLLLVCAWGFGACKTATRSSVKQNQSQHKAQSDSTITQQRQSQHEQREHSVREELWQEEVELWQGASLDSLRPQGAVRRVWRRSGKMQARLEGVDSTAFEVQKQVQHSGTYNAEEKHQLSTSEGQSLWTRTTSWLKWLLFAVVLFRLGWLYLSTRKF